MRGCIDAESVHLLSIAAVRPLTVFDMEKLSPLPLQKLQSRVGNWLRRDYVAVINREPRRGAGRPTLRIQTTDVGLAAIKVAQLFHGQTARVEAAELMREYAARLAGAA